MAGTHAGVNMRQIFHALVLGGVALWSVSVQAHGPYRGHWGYDPWFNSFVMGAAIGTTAVYLSRPYPPVAPATVVVTSPPVVVMNAPPAYASTYTTYSNSYTTYGGYGSYTTISAPMPVVEAYYCPEAAQYYPAVQTCPSTWILVRTR